MDKECGLIDWKCSTGQFIGGMADNAINGLEKAITERTPWPYSPVGVEKARSTCAAVVE